MKQLFKKFKFSIDWQKCFLLVGVLVFYPTLAFSHSSSDFSTSFASCSAHHVAICHTYSGNSCLQFKAGYQPSWFSGCVTRGFSHICSSFPLFPPPHQGCVLEQSTCMCHFNYGNGTYGYEPGVVGYSSSSWFPNPPLFHPLPPPVFPPLANCPFNYSSMCWTFSGRACPQFELGYQSYWFSACLGNGFFHLCVDRPSFPAPVVREVCLLKGSACVCDFGWNNGYYNYEPGMIL